jgi:hypothetical protein
MTMRRIPLMLALAAIVVLLGPQAAATAPPPSPPDPSCSPGPSDCSAWHTEDVTVTWSGPPAGVTANNCGATTISSDTSGTPVSCTWSNGDGSRTTTVTVRRDATQPSASASADRGPDVNGWYNHPLRVTFSGRDATSGLAACTSPASYSGPDSSHAHVGGECKDQAGNWSNPTYTFKYDATPPRLKQVNVGLRGRGVLLTWIASTDAVSFEVSRQPGAQGIKASVIYRGHGRRFTDDRVKHRVKYRYTVTAYDEAGNAKARIALVEPGAAITEESRSTPRAKSPALKPALAAPAEGARLVRPPRLAWRAVPDADYYNVQLFRSGRKILSAWPSGPALRLQRTWTYRGKRYALTAGRYRWYVWPGFGPRSANRYGRLVGTREFVVVP